MLKLKFIPNLDYQTEAVNAVVDLFKGQEYFKNCAGLMEECIGNRFDLSEAEVLSNVKQVQGRNHLPPSTMLTSNDFSIEMETGTGKTYVYLKTIFELNQRYGFSKFIIVVPSVAIKEGVYKSLQMTEEHFQNLYANMPYEYFVYDAQRVEQIRNFATTEILQIMVINIDAFRKSFVEPEKVAQTNLIHRSHERLNGYRPIDLIRETKPIVIIDEPQSVDGTPRAKEAIASLQPLCKLRYSATHREQYTLLYKLDSVDAYERQLVKQIEVATVSIAGDHNSAYIKLLSVDNRQSPIRAKIELDVFSSRSVPRIQRKVKTVQSGDDLCEISGGREVYRGYIINDIFCQAGNEYIDFTTRPEVIKLNEAIGGIDPDAIKRLQIRQTIQEHLEKELRLTPRGVKVLSLFFIDKVSNYRYYDEIGQPQKGKYAQMFEEEYLRLMEDPRYGLCSPEVLRNPAAVEGVHNGYFAIDRKKDARGNGMWKESRASQLTVADESAYNLIMRDKERLLSFDSKLRFIFSHSALKEGWDNPNVFQICTLNETSSGLKKRQELGRGLRMAVNQEGERVPGFEVNTLTVLANESFEEYARQLQKEIEEEGGRSNQDNLPIKNANEQRPSGPRREQAEGLIGAITDPITDTITNVITDTTADTTADTMTHPRDFLRRNCRLGENPDMLTVDSSQLIAKCAVAIRANLKIGNPKVMYQKVSQEFTREGRVKKVRPVSESAWKEIETVENSDYHLPDVIGIVQQETQLTRKTIVNILVESGKLGDFPINPQAFIEGVVKIMKAELKKRLHDPCI